MTQNYRITLLPGDGIGPEIMAVAVDVLTVIGKQFDIHFDFQESLLGGAAIDATGEPSQLLPSKPVAIVMLSYWRLSVVTNGTASQLTNVQKRVY